MGDPLGDGGIDRIEIVPVLDRERVPAERRVAGHPVLGEGELCVAVDRDVVVVVEKDQVVELEMPGQRRRLTRDALHQIAVRDEGEHPEAGGLAEAGREVLAGDRHADRVPGALPERPGGHLDARRVAVLGMPRREAAPLPEALELVERQVVARQVKQRVEQHAAMPSREHEPVAPRPRRVGRVVTQVPRPEDVRHRSGAHREAGMARLGLLDGVHRQGAERVDCQLVDVVVRP